MRERSPSQDDPLCNMTEYSFTGVRQVYSLILGPGVTMAHVT